MKKMIAVMLVLVMALSLCACGKSDEPKEASLDSQVLKTGTLVVGICADYPPFEYLDDSGNLIGFDPDMITWLAEQLKTADGKAYSVEFVQIDFSNIISALQLGQVDVGVAAFSYDPERQCAFTDPYYASAQVVAVRADSEFTKPEDLINGYEIVAGEGTIGFDAATEFFTGSTISSAGGSYLAMFEQVAAGQKDAIVADDIVAQQYVNAGNFKIIGKLSTDELCITVKEGNDKIVEALNAAIKELYDSGKYEELREKWGV